METGYHTVRQKRNMETRVLAALVGNWASSGPGERLSPVTAEQARSKEVKKPTPPVTCRIQDNVRTLFSSIASGSPGSIPVQVPFQSVRQSVRQSASQSISQTIFGLARVVYSGPRINPSNSLGDQLPE